MATHPTPDSGVYKLGENQYKQPYFLEYYTDSTTRRRVYALKREAASQRDDRESVHNLPLEVLRRLAEVIATLEP